MKPKPVPAGTLPLAIHVGFAGARELFDATRHPQADPEEVSAAVGEALRSALKDMPGQLGLLGEPCFFCGLSSMAAGGDLLFSEACRGNGWLQRIFLPQPVDAFLEAIGPGGADFATAERERARQLLESPHVVQERMVTAATGRQQRFREVNLELARASDVVIGLLRADQPSVPGGSGELLELAAKNGIPALELRVHLAAGRPAWVESTWHRREQFSAPQLPEVLRSAGSLAFSAGLAPDVDQVVSQLRRLGGEGANRLRFSFRRSALIIVGGHVLATVLAVLALKLHGDWVAWLIAIELVLLLAGFLVHWLLHHSEVVGRWATLRLVAEAARSVEASRNSPAEQQHLVELPFPAEFRPLLRTLSLLHLQARRPLRNQPWEHQRDEYLRRRLAGPDAGAQIPYRQNTRDRAEFWSGLSRRAFIAASGMAIVSVLVKLLLHWHWLPVEKGIAGEIEAWAGALAIVLPVVAVATVSLAAAFDVEARKHDSDEMLEFLQRQQALLENAETAGEFHRRLAETESRLLGEAVTWHSRRSFTGVA